MASTVESSFGARLLRAQNLLSYISNFEDYNPPRAEENVTEFGKLLENIATLNAEETTLQQQYNTAVTNRVNAFRKSERSVSKLLAPIRAQVQAQYGKNSTEFRQVDSIVKTMRDTKVSVKPATENTSAVRVSQSEQSYGSLTQYFRDLVQTLAQMPDYNPSNQDLQVKQLDAFANQLVQLNNEVAQRYQQLRDSRNRRRELYEELKDRVGRIKAYVKANYGTASSEYELIKGMRI